MPPATAELNTRIRYLKGFSTGAGGFLRRGSSGGGGGENDDDLVFSKTWHLVAGVGLIAIVVVACTNYFFYRLLRTP